MENKSQDLISKDHVAIILEEIKSQGRLTIEQYSGLSKKVDLILEDIDGLKSDVVDIKTELKGINGKLDNKVEKEVVDKHETRIVKLEKTALASG